MPIYRLYTLKYAYIRLNTNIFADIRLNMYIYKQIHIYAYLYIYTRRYPHLAYIRGLKYTDVCQYLQGGSLKDHYGLDWVS